MIDWWIKQLISWCPFLFWNWTNTNMLIVSDNSIWKDCTKLHGGYMTRFHEKVAVVKRNDITCMKKKHCIVMVNVWVTTPNIIRKSYERLSHVKVRPYHSETKLEESCSKLKTLPCLKSLVVEANDSHLFLEFFSSLILTSNSTFQSLIKFL